jgi:ribonuclease R
LSPTVAVVSRRGRFSVAEPLFERGSQLSLGRGGPRVRGGEMVLVSERGRSGRVLEVLGDPTRARDVAAALLLERGLRRGFDERLEEEAGAAAAEARKGAHERRNLTQLATFTVDPVTARDFDDAVSAEAEGDSIRLWIHIADVAAHVRPGSALDAEAARRANSVYVPGTVEPMLPRTLSAGACSLSPDVERLAVTTEMLLAPDATVSGVSFYRSRIRSDQRLSYDELDEYFAGRASPPERIAVPLELARRAAATLVERRSRGSLEVSTSEPEFEFDRDGHVVRAQAVAQTEAHRLIEQLMVVTNEQVALTCERRRIPALYRIHERPDPARVAVLFEQLAALDLPTPPLPENPSPSDAARLAAEASAMVGREAARRGHGQAAYTSLVLRSLKQAVYSDRNLGHAGLASPAYCHFTSPIRRYPDLIVHRALLSSLGGA